MKLFKAPENFDESINSNEFIMFLGGSIDMGAAENWQEKLTEKLAPYDVTILNPRRDDWDSTWKQDPTPGTQFHTQVSWELDGQEVSDLNVYYFSDDSKAPISLMELGLFGNDSESTIVYCTPKFYRYGNVKVVCDRYGIELVETFDDLLAGIMNRFLDYLNG